MAPDLLARFVHTSDLHLGSPCTAGAVAPDHVAEVLQRATYLTFDRIIELCIAESVDALLIAGDVFDSADRSLRAQIAFQKGVQRLADAGIASFVCHGNHDPLDGWAATFEFPELCHRFTDKVESFPLKRGEPCGVVVTGVSYPTRDVRHDLSLRFSRPSNAEVAIALLHANLVGQFGHDAYAPCAEENLVASGFDYWALGHVHERKLIRSSGPVITYPGTPQGRHRKETGPRGVNLVSVGVGGEFRIENRDVATLRWERLIIDLARVETEQQLMDLVRDRLSDLRVQLHQGQCLVYDLTFCGVASLHHSISRNGFCDELVEEINADYSNDDPWAWCFGATLRTQPPFDREGRAKAKDFVGSLLRLIDEAREKETTRDRLYELSTLIGRDPRFSEIVSEPDDKEWLQMLTEAELLCLGALGEVDSK